MASMHEIRRLAFQTLFQLDARGEVDSRDIRESIESVEELHQFDAKERRQAFGLASGAYAHRAQADAAMKELAPTWPAHRQAAVDRAILRLAHFEMLHTPTPPKIVVNEAVELAKEFSTDRSPAFVNGLLDKILRKVRSGPAVPGEPAPPEAS